MGFQQRVPPGNSAVNRPGSPSFRDQELPDRHRRNALGASEHCRPVLVDVDDGIILSIVGLPSTDEQEVDDVAPSPKRPKEGTDATMP